MFNGSQERLIRIVSEQNYFNKKMIKFKEYLVHFVNLSFAAALFLYAIRDLHFFRFHWYFAIFLQKYTYLWM